MRKHTHIKPVSNMITAVLRAKSASFCVKLGLKTSSFCFLMPSISFYLVIAEIAAKISSAAPENSAPMRLKQRIDFK